MTVGAMLKELEAILFDPNYNPIAAIVEGEKKRGFRVVRPGDAPWFRAVDWRAESVASISGNTVRLVLLHCFKSGKGAFTRTVTDIEDAGLRPTVIDPTKEFAAMLKRRGWHGKQFGRTFETRETIWRPK